MKINVLFSPSVVDELYFSEKTVVVIDILRATTTIITALENGAKEIVPVNSIAFAMKASNSIFGGQTLIGGERNTKKIDGFNLGNSPLEYTESNVAAKSIILFTTNGSKAIVKTKYSKSTLISAFSNVRSIAEYLIGQNESSVEIVCSGSNGFFCIEDTVCAGLIIQEIQKLAEHVELSDGSAAALSLALSVGTDIYKMMAASDHGKTLLKNGFDEDIKFCSRLNTSKLIPEYSLNAIHAKQESKAK
jgi:2-phosphosulfolactate phosphatase